MTVAVSKALEEGASAVNVRRPRHGGLGGDLCGQGPASARSSSSPQRAVARGKIAQAQAVGARVLEVQGPFEGALGAAREARAAWDTRAHPTR